MSELEEIVLRVPLDRAKQLVADLCELYGLGAKQGDDQPGAVEVVYRDKQGFAMSFAVFSADDIHRAMLDAGGMSTGLDTLTEAVMEVLDAE